MFLVPVLHQHAFLVRSKGKMEVCVWGWGWGWGGGVALVVLICCFVMNAISFLSQSVSALYGVPASRQ